MIVKILSKSSVFPAVGYNMDKVLAGTAELLAFKNFGLLDAFFDISAADMERYLLAVASLNSRSKAKQLHAIFSNPGISVSKDYFLDIATKWMVEMKMDQQPYLIFFHSDTANRHIHLVSTYIRLDKTKISDSFDYQRAYQALNKILSINIQDEFREKTKKMWSYGFFELSTFQMVLKLRGYRSFILKDHFYVCRYASIVMRVEKEKIKNQFLPFTIESKKVDELKTILKSAMRYVDVSPIPVYLATDLHYRKKVVSFHCELSDYLINTYNIEIIYHIYRNEVSGYTVIDHKNKYVIAGEKILTLERILSKADDQHVQTYRRSR